MKLRGRLIVAAALLAAGGAFAGLSAGTTVFIKAKNTKLLKAAKVDAAAEGAALQPGDEVAWQKMEGKEFHQVKVGGKTGYVFFSNLSTKKPEPEYLQGKGAVDGKAFASSGAATKALAPAATNDKAMSDAKLKEAAKDILAAEALSQLVVTPGVAAAHAKTAGLNRVVGGAP